MKAIIASWILMQLPILAVGPAAVAQNESDSVVKAQALSCEHKTNPVGIDNSRPRLSWQMSSSRRNTLQQAYRIRVAEQETDLVNGRKLIWDTGRVESGQSLYIEYRGPALESGKRYYWQVRIWDNQGSASQWSEPAFWEMGLLSPEEWQADWIHADWEEAPEKSQPSPYLRAEFELPGPVKRARAYVTSMGLYAMELNGVPVGDRLFTPGWTSYAKRLQYQTYDVTALLHEGRNAVGAILGDGWYRGNLGFQGQRNVYGKKLALLLQIRIELADGSTRVVSSNESWKASTGPIRMSDIYNGEHYDARLEMPGWSKPGFDDTGWSRVVEADYPKDHLVAPAGPPVRRIEEVSPTRILKTLQGDTVFDMGQNMVGWTRLRTRCEAGTEIKLRHAEVLDREGNFYTENLRSARQTVRYVCRGGGEEEVYEPHFTFHGFRYVAVEGFPAEPQLDDLTGVVIHSDMEPTGEFKTSDPLINQLQHNIVWGQKGNFLDVPTDCPQRDERLGWTGDAQVFARTAAFNFDVAGFFTKWLRDLAVDQRKNGAVPHVIPDVIGGSASAGWADASVIIPWTMYLNYGDIGLLRNQYPSMKAWVEYMRKAAGEEYLWNSGFHFGDWLAFNTTRSDYPGATTDKDLIATAFYGYSTGLLARAAEVLGYSDDSALYSAQLNRIKEAFNREFVTPGGRLSSNTQTAYALALQFDLLPEEKRAQAADRLARDIESFGDHLTTGFLGTPYLCHVLSRFGHLDKAYALLNQKTYPSWLYPVTQGATTIWERWDGLKPDGTFQDPGMNSFNHYAYGAIGEWLYRVVAGIEIDPEHPGYKHFYIQPHPGGGMTSAHASLKSPYGRIESNWNLEGTYFSLMVRIPPNTTATVRLPDASRERVIERGKALEAIEGILHIDETREAVYVKLGSGQYRFEWDAPRLAETIRAGVELSTYTPLQFLMDDESAVDVLRKLLPGFLDNPSVEKAKALSIRRIAKFAPDQLTDERLDAVDEALSGLKKKRKSE